MIHVRLQLQQAQAAQKAPSVALLYKSSPGGTDKTTCRVATATKLQLAAELLRPALRPQFSPVPEPWGSPKGTPQWMLVNVVKSLWLSIPSLWLLSFQAHWVLFYHLSSSLLLQASTAPRLLDRERKKACKTSWGFPKRPTRYQPNALFGSDLLPSHVTLQTPLTRIIQGDTRQKLFFVPPTPASLPSPHATPVLRNLPGKDKLTW